MKFPTLAAALVAVSPLASAAETLSGPYTAEVVRVVDGDTVELRVRVWLGLDQTIRVRLRGIDAPEMHGPCRAAAEVARDALARLLGDGPVVLSRIAHDKFGGRVDATLHAPTGEDASAALLAAGLVRPWPHPKGDSACPPLPHAAAAPKP